MTPKEQQNTREMFKVRLQSWEHGGFFAGNDWREMYFKYVDLNAKEMQG